MNVCQNSDEAISLSSLDYHLPEEKIAYFPPKDRTSARLLGVSRQSGALQHTRFSEIEQELKSGDVLVLNDTKVIPARLLGHKENGTKVETFLLKQIDSTKWRALMRPSRRIKKDALLTFENGDARLVGTVLDDPSKESGERLIEFKDSDFFNKLNQLGHMPLPPYIHREDSEEDKVYYQTVFARHLGAVAAPTAALHFDQPLLDRLEAKGVEIVFVTLHVSYGTFQPIQEEDVKKHDMHEEEFEVSSESADRINAALNEKRRVVACGTTTVRVLESAVSADGLIKAQKNVTSAFIFPPYDFKVVKGLITNFHLPKSTLLLLVSAFLGGEQSTERLLEIYKEAMNEDYRFYSYGDAMFIS